MFSRRLAAAAPAGATRVELTDTSDLIVGRSGLSGLTDYWAAEALLTAIEGKTVRLSKPLPKALSAEKPVSMATLKYRPFSVPGSADYRKTMAGWLEYVDVITAFVTETLGTAAAADKGFDLEIWNELTFGTHFLYVNDYYEPRAYQYSANDIWTNLVKATADHVAARCAPVCRRPPQQRLCQYNSLACRGGATSGDYGDQQTSLCRPQGFSQGREQGKAVGCPRRAHRLRPPLHGDLPGILRHGPPDGDHGPRYGSVHEPDWLGAARPLRAGPTRPGNGLDHRSGDGTQRDRHPGWPRRRCG